MYMDLDDAAIEWVLTIRRAEHGWHRKPVAAQWQIVRSCEVLGDFLPLFLDYDVSVRTRTFSEILAFSCPTSAESTAQQ
jgi:hypothetical protein